MVGTRTSRDARSGTVTGADAWLLTLITESTNEQIREALAPDELSVEQWRTLDYLAFSGPSTMSVLAVVTTVNGASLTRLVDHLVERALVYRDSDSQDRRRVLVHLSGRGRRKVRQLRPRVLEAEAAVTAGLTNEERRELTSLLRRMAPVHSATITRNPD